MPVLLVQNITRESPGQVQRILRARNIPFDIVDLQKGQEFPDTAPYNAVFVFGGPNSANDNNVIMQQEIVKVKKTIDAKIPFLGVCLGMQVMAKACGGKVFPNDVSEIGWKDQEENFFEIELTGDGARDPFFSHIAPPIKIFQLHGETVSLSPEMKLLATGKYCANQAIKVGDSAYGVQGHFELTPELFERLLNEDQDLSELDQEKLRDDYDKVRIDYEISSRQIITNFLAIAGLIE